VLVRTQDPDRFGDSITGQNHVAEALKGNKTSGIEADEDLGLVIRAGTPLKNRSGTIVGTVSLGWELGRPSFVDSLKALSEMLTRLSAVTVGQAEQLQDTISFFKIDSRI